MESNENTLARFCRLFNVSDVSCNCENTPLRKILEKKFPEICEQTVLTTSVTFSYNNDYSIAYGVIAIVASLIAFAGNSLVIIVGWRNRRTFLTCQKLIAILAICDLTFAVVQLLLGIPILWTHNWLYGEFMCKFLHSGMFAGSVIAIGLIVIISVERFLGVLRPMMKTARLIIGLCWGNVVIGISSVVPLLLFLTVNKDRCDITWPNDTASTKYYYVTMFSMIVLPVCIIFCLYSYIIYALRRGLTDQAMQEAMEEKFYKKRLSESRRVMKIVLALVIAFIVLVFPNRIITLYLDKRVIDSTTLYYALSLIARITYPFHVAINPFLYCFIDSRWRKAIRDVFTLQRPPNRFRGSTGNEYTLSSPISEHKKRFNRVETFQTIAYGSEDTLHNSSV